jgi:signal peptidase I
LEYRLFVIGVLMGVYSWLCRRRERGGRAPAFWHAAFWGLAAFSGSLVLLMSFQDRPRYATLAGIAVPVGEVLPALAAAAVMAGLGYRHGLTRLKNAETRARMRHEDLEWSDTVFSSALMASLLMMFVLQAFKIPSGSMEQTLLIGDQLFVNKFIYGLKIPFADRRALAVRPVRRGDVLVFRFPTEDVEAVHCGTKEYGNDLIKRVVGLPGETVEVRAGRVLVDGKPLGDEPYAQWTGSYHQPRSPRAAELTPEQYQQIWQDRGLEDELQGVEKDYFGPVKVPERSYFMMGDNRDYSCDSRYWGPVPESYVKGKAWFIYWPPNRLGPIR